MKHPTSFPDAGQFRSVVEHLDLPILAIDQAGCVVFVNQAVSDIAGEPDSTLLGQHLQSVLGLSDRAFTELMDSMTSGDTHEPLPVLISCRGTRRSASIRKLDCAGSGEDMHYVLAIEGLEWWESSDAESLAASRLLFFETNVDGRFAHGHVAWATMLGLDQEDVLERRLVDFVSDGEREALNEVWQRVLEGEPVQSGEIVMCGDDGVARPLSLTLFPLRNLDGAVTSVRGTAQSLEVEKGLAYALESAEERFSVLFRDSSDPILILTLQGEVLSANQTFEDFTGCSSGELFRGEKSLSDCVHKDDIQHVEKGFQECSRGEANAIVEFRMLSKTGDVEWFEQRHSILHDEKHKPKGILAVARNIHTRKQREMQLQEEARSARERNVQAQVLISRLTEFFTRTTELPADLESYVHGVCRILSDMYHPLYTSIYIEEDEQRYLCIREDAETSGFRDVLQRMLPTAMCRRVAQGGAAMVTDTLQDVPEYAADPLVQLNHLHSYLGAPLRDSTGRIRGSLALLDSQARSIDNMDVELLTVAALQIASRIRIQEEEQAKLGLENHLRQAQKMEAVGVLAGGIAHDFNNILSGILGFTSFLLTRVEQGSDIHRDLSLIEKSAERAADLTRQLLAFARRKHFAKETIQIGEIVNETMGILTHSLPKNVRVDVKVDESLPLVLGDAGQLNQVIMNLCINGADAMAQHGGDLVVRMEHKPLNERERSMLIDDASDPDDFICVTVSDSGMGMDEEALTHIFDPFYTTKTLRGGTGLGLSIVYGIVTNHGGDVIVDSEVGKGSTFRVYLPVYKGEVVSAEVSDAVVTLDGTETILVVDDELIVRQMVHEVLKGYGYEILVAASGDEAVELYEDVVDRVDLILLDMVMPGMSGEATFRALREINPEANVLLTTGFASEGQSDILLKEGALDIIHKPYKSELLLTQLRRIFQALSQVQSTEP